MLAMSSRSSPMSAAGCESGSEMEPESPKSSLQQRFGKMLRVSTARVSIGPLEAARKSTGFTPKTVSRGRIRQIASFEKSYTLGKELMPSTHDYMKIHSAIRRSDGEEVVIKLRFKPGCFKNKDDELNWRRSTEYLLNMPDSSHIAIIYEVLEDSRSFYIVMEKVPGMDLCETLKQGSVAVEDARSIVKQLLAAMAHLHSHDAVHKDLKLENVMLDASPTSRSGSPLSPTSVKVIDFDTVDQWNPSSARPAKDVVGTDQYIAQEAYAGKNSPLSDIFAVGVIAYKLLCGRFPFHADIFDDEVGENWVGSPKMRQIRSRLRVAKVDFAHPVFEENPEALDLVKSMLSYSEHCRPTAAAALEHAWLQEGESASSSSTYAAQTSMPALDYGAVVAQESSVGEDHRLILRSGERSPGSAGSPPRWSPDFQQLWLLQVA